MPAKTAFSLLAFAVLVGPLAAQPAAKPVDDKALVTKEYNVKLLIGERGKENGIADVDAVVKLIVQAIPQLRDLQLNSDGPQIVERDGGKLEVRATEKVQNDVKGLLDALDRLADTAINLKADVIELDLATYEKLVKALPKGNAKVKLPVLFVTRLEFDGKEPPAGADQNEAMSKILKAGRVVQTSSGRFGSGAEATVAARRTFATFKNFPEPLLVKEGFALWSQSVVSADRRSIRMKLTEQSTAITGVRKLELGEMGGQKIVMQTPEVEDLGATGSATVADGGTAIFRLAYAPKDKVWVVVLKPTIFIQAEEDELKKEGKPIKP